MYKAVFITIWLILLSLLYLLLNGTMESYVHFNTDQSSFRPEFFLQYFFYLLIIAVILIGTFIVLVKRVKLDAKSARIIYAELRLFSISWLVFALNLVLSFFLIDVEYPLGLIWYVIQIGLLGFAVYKLVKGNSNEFLTIIDEKQA